MPEHFFQHIQKPILVSTLYTYPELSKHHLKPQKRSEKFMPVSVTRKLLVNNFSILSKKIAQLRIGISGQNWYRRTIWSLRVLNISEKIFWCICKQNSNSKLQAKPLFAARGPIRGGETVAQIWPQVY
jgi:hypothetical protein